MSTYKEQGSQSLLQGFPKILGEDRSPEVLLVMLRFGQRDPPVSGDCFVLRPVFPAVPVLGSKRPEKSDHLPAGSSSRDGRQDSSATSTSRSPASLSGDENSSLEFISRLAPAAPTTSGEEPAVSVWTARQVPRKGTPEKNSGLRTADRHRSQAGSRIRPFLFDLGSAPKSMAKLPGGPGKRESPDLLSQIGA